MNRFLNLSSAFILLLGLSGAAHAYTINDDFTNVANQYTSPYFATVEDFDGSLTWTWTGSGAVVSGSVDGKYSAPGGVDGINKDITKYMTVPDPTGGSTGSIRATDLGGVYNYFGLWWGSIDTYNTFTFYKNDAVVLSFTGTEVTLQVPTMATNFLPVQTIMSISLGCPISTVSQCPAHNSRLRLTT